MQSVLFFPEQTVKVGIKIELATTIQDPRLIWGQSDKNRSMLQTQG